MTRGTTIEAKKAKKLREKTEKRQRRNDDTEATAENSVSRQSKKKASLSANGSVAPVGSVNASVMGETAVMASGENIVWVNGPFKCGKWPDIKIFRSKLKFYLAKGEMVEADKGYAGDNKCYTPHDIFDEIRQKNSNETTNDNHNLSLDGCLEENNSLKKIGISFGYTRFDLRVARELSRLVSYSTLLQEVCVG